MKRLSAWVLLFALLLCACETNVRVEESGQDAFQSYQLPTEWRVTKNGATRTFSVSYDGNTATVTEDGETVLRFTLDEAGNAVQRENANGSRIDAIYDADGRLTETLLRDADGELQQRTVYDERGRAVREYTSKRYGEVSMREFTYSGDGELLSEAQYNTFESHTYEYHESGALAAEVVLRMDALPYYRQEFDEAGRMTWEISYDADGNVSHRYEYDEDGKIAAEYDEDGNLYVDERKEELYDDNGNLTESKRYNEDGTLYERYEYDYDENGNQVAWRHYHSDGTLSREVFRTYSEAGVLKKAVQKDYSLNNGELFEATETEYDEAGNQIRYSVYDAEETLSSRTEMEYEFLGGKWAMTRRTAYNGDGSLWCWGETIYDEKGNCTAELTYDADGILSIRIENTYDERGNQTEHIRYDGQGNVFYREVSVYDEQDHLQEYTNYNGDGGISTHVVYESAYEYDDGGRPIRAVRASVGSRLTYAYESGSGLRKVTCNDGDGNVAYTEETVFDNNGNPRILQNTRGEYERRYEYEWTPEGGLRTCVQSYTGEDGEKEEYARLEASGYVECSLTEAQYRQMLELLLEATGVIYIPNYTIAD